MRSVTSTAPPGAESEMMRTGLVGWLSTCAREGPRQRYRARMLCSLF
jgi:hypothetical protein